LVENLIEREMRRRNIVKERPNKLNNVKRIGKGLGGFLSGAAKGFGGLVKEGAKLSKDAIHAEIKSELSTRKAIREAKRKARVKMAYREAGLLQRKKIKNKNKGNKGKGIWVHFD